MKMVGYLPQEILIDIFTRLPIKTLLQCTSVCKSWHSLIRDPAFINAHLNRPRTVSYNNTHNLLLVRTCSEESQKEQYSLHCDNDEAFEEYAKLDFPFDRAASNYYRIVGSCDGVLCLTDDQFTYVHDTILWNPMIRKWVRLPRPRVTFLSHGPFDHAIGFGFDAKSNEYKVVRIVHLLDEFPKFPPEVDVYTLSTGTWRNISHLRLQYEIDGKAPQSYLNGASHWIGSDMNRRCNMIVSFHMGDEVFRCFNPPAGMPFYPYANAEGLRPALIQGSLSLVEQNRFGDKKRWCIWVMREYGVSSSWTKQLDIGVDERIDRLIGFRKNGELLISARGDLISHDPIAAQAKELGIRSGSRSLYHYSFHTDCYTESLVLVGSQVQIEENKNEKKMKNENEKKTKKQRRRSKADCYTESLVLIESQVHVEEKEKENENENEKKKKKKKQSSSRE